MNSVHGLSRRKFLLGSGGLAALALAACAAPVAAPSDTSQEAAPAAMPEAVEVDLWHGLGGADGKTFTELVGQYMEENDHVTVNEELLTWDIFYQKVPSSVIAGNPPDMIITHEWAIGQWGPRRVLSAADDFYDSMGVPRDDFIPSVFENIHYEGSPLGVLLDTHGSGGYLNVALVEAAGLDPASPPTNRTEFVEQMSMLTLDSQGRNPTDAGFDPEDIVQYAFHSHFWRRWAMLEGMWQNGGNTINEDGTQSTIDSEEVTEALAFWHTMVHEHHLHAVPVGYSMTDSYQNNTLGLAIAGSWWRNFIQDSNLVDTTTFWRVPQYGLVQPVAWMSAHVMGIPTGTDEEGMTGASELIVWLSNHGLDWARSGQPPARISLQNDPVLQDHWHTGNFGSQFQAIGRTEQQHANITEIQNAYQQEFEAVITNVKTVSEGIAEAHLRVQEVLDRDA